MLLGKERIPRKEHEYFTFKSAACTTRAKAVLTFFQSTAAQGPIHSSAARLNHGAHLLCNYTKHKSYNIKVTITPINWWQLSNIKNINSENNQLSLSTVCQCLFIGVKTLIFLLIKWTNEWLLWGKCFKNVIFNSVTQVDFISRYRS